MALNNAFPIRRARAARFDELTQANAKLSACGSIGPGLRGALRSEGRRLWLLIDSVSFFNPQKDAILTAAEKGVQALSQLVAIADSVNSLRAECDGVAQPIRTLVAIAEHLRAAEDALMRFDPAGSQAHVSAAAVLARTDCDPKTLAPALTADIKKLLTERPNNGDPIPVHPRNLAACHTSRDEAIKHGRPGPIAQRIVLLELNRANVSGQPLADLLSLEQTFYIADIWTNIIEIAVNNASKDAPDRFTAMAQAATVSTASGPRVCPHATTHRAGQVQCAGLRYRDRA